MWPFRRKKKEQERQRLLLQTKHDQTRQTSSYDPVLDASNPASPLYPSMLNQPFGSFGGAGFMDSSPSPSIDSPSPSIDGGAIGGGVTGGSGGGVD